MQVRSGPSKLTNHHLNRTRQLVDHLLLLGPRTVTLQTHPRWADGKSLSHTEPLPFQPRNMYTKGDALRRFGGSIACKEVWIEAACTRWLQGKCGVGARIEHEVVAQCEGLRCVVQPLLFLAWAHSKILSDVSQCGCEKKFLQKQHEHADYVCQRQRLMRQKVHACIFWERMKSSQCSMTNGHIKRKIKLTPP